MEQSTPVNGFDHKNWTLPLPLQCVKGTPQLVLHILCPLKKLFHQLHCHVATSITDSVFFRTHYYMYRITLSTTSCRRCLYRTKLCRELLTHTKVKLSFASHPLYVRKTYLGSPGDTAITTKKTVATYMRTFYTTDFFRLKTSHVLTLVRAHLDALTAA